MIDGEIENRTDYDVNSIMHYHSYQMCNDDCKRNITSEAVLVKYKDPDHHEYGTEMIPDPLKPTSMDAMWVKNTYPWNGWINATARGDSEYDENGFKWVLHDGKVEALKRG